jgi:hypothetical protein
MAGAKKRRKIRHVRNINRSCDSYFARHGKSGTRRLSGMGGLPAVAASDQQQWLNLGAGCGSLLDEARIAGRKET